MTTVLSTDRDVPNSRLTDCPELNEVKGGDLTKKKRSLIVETRIALRRKDANQRLERHCHFHTQGSLAAAGQRLPITDDCSRQSRPLAWRCRPHLVLPLQLLSTTLDFLLHHGPPAHPIHTLLPVFQVSVSIFLFLTSIHVWKDCRPTNSRTLAMG